MKYIILIGDGMADAPIDELGGKTPLEYAPTPNMDRLVEIGSLGLFHTVPEGYPPGSDVANLSILGYDPALYYTGRAPLEAASIGVDLEAGDIAFRCNFVTLADTDGKTIMADYSAGHLSTEEGAKLISSLDEGLRARGVRFYPGKSYRHLMVWEGGKDALDCTPPHDISDREATPHLPKGDGAEFLIELTKASWDILKDHPVNLKRIENGQNPATSIWLWGQGKAPSIPTLKERFALSGSIISAVDLMNGMGVYAGLNVITVPGATGYIDTNYEGKADYALKSLDDNDFICVHVEAPDEAGHQGDLQAKLKAIADFDARIVGPILKGAERFGDFKVMVLPDHPTPVEIKTHTSDPVPFVLYSTHDAGGERTTHAKAFTEKEAAGTGLVARSATKLSEEFFS